MGDLLLEALVQLVVILDPLGIVPFFMVWTQDLEAVERRRVALRGVFIAACVLVGASLLGGPLLRWLGISLASFRIAGGTLLLLLAIDMVFARQTGLRATTAAEDEEASHRDDVAVFPLAIPLIAGPGAITSVILLATRAPDALTHVALVGVLLAVLGAAALALLAAPRIMRVLGLTGINVLTRVLGITLAALAVQLMLDGLAASGLFGAVAS